MKLIKDVVVTYNEFNSGNTVSDMDGFVEAIIDTVDATSYFFEVGEDDTYVYFAVVGGHDWEPIDSEDEKPDAVMVETAVYVKETNEVVFFADNDVLDDPTCLDGYAYWTRVELEYVGAVNFRDMGRSELGNVSVWTEFV